MSESRFEELVNAHGRDVLNTALRVLGDPETAKDVYQEVFLAIWRRWHTYNGTVQWRAYLRRVTIREALKLARMRRHVSNGPTETEPFAPGGGPDAGLRLAEAQRKLASALARLPKRQAEVFVLSRIEGLDHATVAGMLGCTINSVRVSLHRAVKRLVREMGDYRS